MFIMLVIKDLWNYKVNLKRIQRLMKKMGLRGISHIYMERFWRAYKYECIYLREINTLKDLREITKEWVSYYNSNKLNQNLE